MKLILSEKKINALKDETNKRISRFCNDCEGNFKQADIDDMYDEGDTAIALASQEATLRAVGTWLRKHRHAKDCLDGELVEYIGITDQDVESCERGEFPGKK